VVLRDVSAGGTSAVPQAAGAGGQHGTGGVPGNISVAARIGAGVPGSPSPLRGEALRRIRFRGCRFAPLPPRRPTATSCNGFAVEGGLSCCNGFAVEGGLGGVLSDVSVGVFGSDRFERLLGWIDCVCACFVLARCVRASLAAVGSHQFDNAGQREGPTRMRGRTSVARIAQGEFAHACAWGPLVQ
jgi:hypothetical protein